ncbi:MAG: ABC transporter ATP-binding protein [Candidatus Omnitrophota bacterium]
MGDLIYELKGVYFSYLAKFPALCGIDMNIKRGEKLAVIGANGSGKSTLLQILDGIIFPDKGSLKAFGRELKESAFDDESFSKYFRSKVGLAFQNSDAQLFCPTVKEDIIFGPLQLGVAKEEIKKRLDKLVAILGLGGLLDRPPYQLSVGEKRKVSIASTLAVEPDVIILDEPTAGLDPLTSRHILDIVIQANLDGKTVITATHDLHIVEEISDTVYVLSRDKKIARACPPHELLEDSRFLEEHNLVHIHSHRHKDQVHTHPHEHLGHHFI